MDEAQAINEVDQYQDEDYDGTDYEGLEELSFPFSEYSKEPTMMTPDLIWNTSMKSPVQQHLHMHFTRQEVTDIVL